MRLGTRGLGCASQPPGQVGRLGAVLTITNSTTPHSTAQAFWTPTSVRVVVKEGSTTGPVVYDFKANATSCTTNWDPSVMYAFLGTNNAAYTGVDGTRTGMTLRNFWVGSTPRPTTLGSAIAQR